MNAPASPAQSAGRAVAMVGICLMIVGVLAMAGPQYSGFAVNMALGVLLIVAGILRTGFAWLAWTWGETLLRFAMGMFAIFAGGYMLANPDTGLRALTLALAILFALEGISTFVFALRLPPMSGAPWVMLDGIVSLLVAGLIWAQWPSSAEWAVGIIIGVKLFVDGLVITAVGMTVKNIGSAIAEAAAGPGGDA